MTSSRGLDEKLLDLATPRQRKAAELVNELGSAAAAAQRMGIGASTVRTLLLDMRKRAARRGYAPDHDMTRPVPEGFRIQGVSTYYPATEDRPYGQWVKAKDDGQQERIDAALDQIRAICEPYQGKRSKIAAPPKHADADMLTVYGWGDPHIGMLAWGRETGTDFDLAICEETMARAVDHMVGIGGSSSTALIVSVGDTFHANSPDNRTPAHKHILDVDGRHQKIMDAGARIFDYNIRRALEKHDRVHVVITPGNHDPEAGPYLAFGLDLLYRDNERVTVDRQPGRLQWYRHGRCFFGFTHGDSIKPPQLPITMAEDRPQDWAASTWRHFYTGHLHHSHVRELTGATVETLRTMAPRDAYAHNHGFRSQRGAIVDQWHRNKGRVQRSDITPAMIES